MKKIFILYLILWALNSYSQPKKQYYIDAEIVRDYFKIGFNFPPKEPRYELLDVKLQLTISESGNKRTIPIVDYDYRKKEKKSYLLLKSYQTFPGETHPNDYTQIIYWQPKNLDLNNENIQFQVFYTSAYQRALKQSTMFPGLGHFHLGIERRAWLYSGLTGICIAGLIASPIIYNSKGSIYNKSYQARVNFKKTKSVWDIRGFNMKSIPFWCGVVLPCTYLTSIFDLKKEIKKRRTNDQE